MFSTPSDRIYADPNFVDDFIEHILGFNPNSLVIMTNISTLSDFFGIMEDDDYKKIQSAIKNRYGVELQDSDCDLIADILDRIRDSKNS